MTVNFTVYDPERSDLGGNAHHGDVQSFCPRLWRYIVERFGVQSMLDVGCGEGHAVLFFRRLGVIAHGIDGTMINVQRAITPIALHDLTKGPYTYPCDLVWSCEVAEHIDEQFVDNYLGSLANGRIIAMTHGIPGQDGHHHVNNQPREYWIEKLRSYNFELDSYNGVFTELAKREDSDNYFRTTGLVFLRS